MSAGLHHEAAPPTVMNVEQMLRDKIMVVKLTTGELLIAAVYHNHEQGITLGHPYEIKEIPMEAEGEWFEVPTLEWYCPYVKNRIFFFGWSNVVFAKEANANFANIYLEEFARCEHDDYIKLLVTYQTQMKAKQDAKAISFVGDSMVRMEGNKIFIMGNETKH